MTDDEFLDCLRVAERVMDRTRSHHDTLRQLDQATCGRVTNRRQREALGQILSGLSKGSAQKLDETIQLLQSYLRRIDSPRQHEKMIRFAENYGATQPTLDVLRAQGMHIDMVKAHEVMHDLMLKPLIKEAYQTMTSTELQVQLDAALKTEAAAAAAKAADDKLVYHIDLATATKNLLESIRRKSTGPVTGLPVFRKELAPLAREFGFKVILVGEAAYVVQR